jgi:hypothetical protein
LEEVSRDEESECALMKYCQGPNCHKYKTKDRLRGPKGNKSYQTRRRSFFPYLGGNACSMACQDDWFNKFGDRAVDHFGRIVEPIKLTEENAWVKLERYYGNGNPFYWYNRLTEQERPLTQEQYNNPSLVRP